VARADVAVVQLEKAALWATPDDPARETQDDQVVERQPGRRIHSDAGMRRQRNGVIPHTHGCYVAGGDQDQTPGGIFRAADDSPVAIEAWETACLTSSRG